MDRELNIVLYINSFLPKIGGREIVVFYLAKALLRLGNRVRVLGPSKWWQYRKHKFEFPVHRWPGLRGALRDTVRYGQLSLDVSLWGADIIHAHNTYPTGFIGARLKRRRQIPVVITPHGDDIHVIPEIGHGLRLRPEFEPKIREAVQQASLVTSISENMKASLLDAGAPEGNIRTIPNGIDIERFSADHGVDVRSQFALPPDAKIVLTVGSYQPRRGYEDLVRAMQSVSSSEPSVHLVIVGRGTQVLRPLIDKLSLNDKILLAGEIKFPAIEAAAGQDLLAALYQASSLYLSTGMAEGAEGLSLAVLDAMAAGVPIIATDISGNRDIIAPGETGSLVPPGDCQAIAGGALALLRNPTVSRRMGQAARCSIAKYGWDEVARQYVDVYREAIALTKGLYAVADVS